MTLPLEGIRVLDFTWMQQGPFSTTLLADMGAEVIKVEHREGERGRAVDRNQIPEPVPYFIAHNRGKRSITLDVRRPEGREIVERFVQKVDVVVSNMRIGKMDALGFSYEYLSSLNPRIVYACGSAFGPLGERSQAPGNDIVGQSAGGITTRTGHSEGIPTPVGAAIADQTGEIFLCTGILAALVQRERTGLGDQLDVSLYGSQIALQSWEITDFSLSGKEAGKGGYGHPLLTYRSVWRTFETSNGWIAIGGPATDKFKALAEIVDLPELAEKYPDDASRAAAMEDIQPQLQEQFLKKSKEFWLAKFKEKDIFAGPVQSYEDIVVDPQARENGYIATMAHPSLGDVAIAGTPIQFGRSPRTTLPPPPELGDYTERYLSELNYSWDEIVNLREIGVV